MGHPAAGRPAGPYNPAMPILEALMTLSYLAAATRRVTLGTEVLVLPQRQPALVAKQVSTLDTLSGGRVRLGVGVGWQESEYEALGEEFATRRNDPRRIQNSRHAIRRRSYDREPAQLRAGLARPKPSTTKWQSFGGAAAFPHPVASRRGRRRGSKKKHQRRPVSRVLCLGLPRGDGHFSRAPVARRLERPYPGALRGPRFTRVELTPGAGIAPLFGLAPGGVFRADAVTRAAGELLPHRFTLTARPEPDGGLLSVALVHGVAPPGR
jgi:hypothetical protein